MAGGASRSFQLVNYLLLVLLGLVAFLLLADFGRQLVTNQQRHTELQEIEEELSAAIQQEKELEERLRYSRSNAAAEAWARQLGWTRADERAVVIVDADQYSSTDPLNPAGQSSSAPSSGDGLWSLLFSRP